MPTVSSLLEVIRDAIALLESNRGEHARELLSAVVETVESSEDALTGSVSSDAA